jgi:hypothetical protein
MKTESSINSRGNARWLQRGVRQYVMVLLILLTLLNLLAARLSWITGRLIDAIDSRQQSLSHQISVLESQRTKQAKQIPPPQ